MTILVLLLALVLLVLGIVMVMSGSSTSNDLRSYFVRLNSEDARTPLHFPSMQEKVNRNQQLDTAEDLMEEEKRINKHIASYRDIGAIV